MACIKAEGTIFRLVELEDYEDRQLVREAREAGVSVDKYIHDKVLAENTLANSQNCPEVEELRKIRGLLLQHKAAVDYIAERVSWFTNDAKPSYWVFDTNLMLIRELMSDLKKVDETLHQDILDVIDGDNKLSK